MARFIRPQGFAGGGGARVLPSFAGGGRAGEIQRMIEDGTAKPGTNLYNRLTQEYQRLTGQPYGGVGAVSREVAPEQATAEEALGLQLREERRGGLEEAEADRQAALADLEQQQAKAESALVEARDKGLLTEEEAQQMEVEQRESYEAQFDRLSREMGEATYGMAMGTRRGAAREVGVERAKAVGGIPGRIRAERMGRRREAYGRYGEQVAGLRERYGARRAGIRERAERIIPTIPEQFTPAQHLVARTGQIRRFQGAQFPGTATMPRYRLS